jgi:UDP-N-acetyl-2-amino-2-deoxyglucuronate dehydrogenase
MINKNFGIIGMGHIGKRHASIILGNKESTLVATCDIAIGSASCFRPTYKIHKEMIKAHPEMDAVCICTPNGLHAQMAIDCLEAGLHVIIEKPLGLTKKECEDVIHTGLQNGRHVFAVMQNRYSPPSVWLKEIIDEGLLGDICIAQINCYWNRDGRYYKKGGWKGTKLLDGGTLFTQFSHFVDIMYWLLGDVTNIHSRLRDFTHSQSTEFEDSGVITFDFSNGGIGSFNFSTSVWGGNLESSITIIGKNGSVKVGGQYMNEVEICNIKDYEMPELDPCNPPNDYGEYKGSAANHHYVIQNALDTMLGRASPTTNSLEGMKVVDIIERFYEK